MAIPLDSTPVLPVVTPAVGGELGVDGSGRVCFYNATLGRVVPLIDETEIAPFTWSGVLTVKTGTLAWVCEYPGSIIAVRSRLTTAPTGTGSTIADLKKNGTSMYTTTGNRPSWAAASNGGAHTLPDTVAFSAGDYITADILSLAATTPGSDLVLRVSARRT